MPLTASGRLIVALDKNVWNHVAYTDSWKTAVVYTRDAEMMLEAYVNHP
jgi:hypothetical protein